MATTSNPQSQNPTNSSSAQASTSRPKGKRVVDLVHANAVAINFAIKADALESSVPQQLKLDFYEGDTFVSLVCMEVKRLSFCGLPIVPKFCELSLRCFVSERDNPENQGVLFLKSYASSKFGAWVLSNLIPHSHSVMKIKAKNDSEGPRPPDLDYQWKIEGHDNRMRIRGRDIISRHDSSSKLGFIMAHSARYQTIHGHTSVYDVTRPEWVLWDAAQANFTCDVRRLFGKEYVKPMAARPVSVFMSAGSRVTLHQPRELK